MTQEFETRLANYLGVKYATTVNSGSSANLAAFMALTSESLGDRRIKSGDEVITVAAGFPTTVNPIIQAGCIPVFIDIDINTLAPDSSLLAEALSPRTKAIMLAHPLGNPFDISAVVQFCQKHRLWLVEDNCDALGSTYLGRKTGSFGHISTLSFYPAHHITTGEGGAIFTNSHRLNRLIRSYRDWGRDCWCPTGKDNTCGVRFGWQLGDLPKGYDHKYTYSQLGYNLKMTDIQAACGLAQLDKLPQFVDARKQNYQRLSLGLAPFADYLSVVKATENSEPSWFGLPLVLSDTCPFSREELIIYLNDRKIATRLFFGGNLTRQPYFSKSEIVYRTIGKLTQTDKAMTDAFWIGVYPGITTPMIDWIIKSVSDFLVERGLKV